MFFFLGGVIIDLICYWPIALVCIGLAPFLMIGEAINVKVAMCGDQESGDKNKEADLFCGHAILNFKTVESFGYEELMVKKYKELLMPALIAAQSSSIKSGFVFGYSQFAV